MRRFSNYRALELMLFREWNFNRWVSVSVAANCGKGKHKKPTVWKSIGFLYCRGEKRLFCRCWAAINGVGRHAGCTRQIFAIYDARLLLHAVRIFPQNVRLLEPLLASPWRVRLLCCATFLRFNGWGASVSGGECSDSIFRQPPQSLDHVPPCRAAFL